MIAAEVALLTLGGHGHDHRGRGAEGPHGGGQADAGAVDQATLGLGEAGGRPRRSLRPLLGVLLVLARPGLAGPGSGWGAGDATAPTGYIVLCIITPNKVVLLHRIYSIVILNI